MTDNLAARILDIVARETQRELTDLNLTDNIGNFDIQSLDMVQIIYGIEEEFDIFVPQESAAFEPQTLQDIVDGVGRLIAETASDSARPS